MFVDTGVKQNCWNGRESFGEICVHCGCCSENKEERIKNRIYKLNMWICEAQTEIDTENLNVYEKARVDKVIKNYIEEKQKYIHELRGLNNDL